MGCYASGVPRFVVRYRGKGPYPEATLEKIQAAGASIIERAGRMLLVDGTERTLRDVLDPERDWSIAPEVSYEQPNPRFSVK